MIENKNILITGGAGFIGGTLTKKLADYNKIFIYDNLFHQRKDFLELLEHKNVTFIKGNVLNYELLNKTMALNNINIIVHAAAVAGINTVIKNPVHTMQVNMIGTTNVLEAAKENISNIEKVIEFSTSEVFGPIAYKSSENDQTIAGTAGEARWTYAVSKLAGEHMTKAYYHQYGLPTVTVRPFNIYGPGQIGDSAMKTFIKRALKNEEITITGDGSQIRAWCYVDDFVTGLIACIENTTTAGECFNIGNSCAVTTILRLAKTICRITNSESNIKFAPASSADIYLRIPSVQKAEKKLNFKAKVDLEEGIEKTAAFFKGLNDD